MAKTTKMFNNASALNPIHLQEKSKSRIINFKTKLVQCLPAPVVCPIGLTWCVLHLNSYQHELGSTQKFVK